MNLQKIIDSVTVTRVKIIYMKKANRILKYLIIFVFALFISLSIKIYGLFSLLFIIIEAICLFILNPVYLFIFLLSLRPYAEKFSIINFVNTGYSHGILNMNSLFAAIVIIVFFVSLFLNLLLKREDIGVCLKDPIFKLWTIFFVYFGLISITFSPKKLLSLFDLGRFAAVIAIYLLALVYGPIKKKIIIILLLSIVISSLPVAYEGIFNYIKGNYTVAFSLVHRTSGFFVNPVSLSQYLALIMLVSIILIKIIKIKLMKIIFILYFLIVGLCAALTYGKGGWIGFLGGFFILGMFQENKMKRMTYMMLIAIFIIILISLLPNLVPYLKTIFYYTDNPERSSLSSRLIAWNYYIDVFRNNYIVGVGLMGGYVKLYETIGFYSEPHSDILRLLVDGGIFGLLIYSAIVIVTIKRLYFSIKLFRKKDNFYTEISNLGLSMYVAFLIMASFDNILTSLALQYPIWIIIGIISKISMFQNKEII